MLAEIMEDIVDHKLYMEQGFALVCHVLYDDDVDDPSFIALCNIFSLYDAVKYGSDAQPDKDYNHGRRV